MALVRERHRPLAREARGPLPLHKDTSRPCTARCELSLQGAGNPGQSSAVRTLGAHLRRSHVARTTQAHGASSGSAITNGFVATASSTASTNAEVSRK